MRAFNFDVNNSLRLNLGPDTQLGPANLRHASYQGHNRRRNPLVSCGPNRDGRGAEGSLATSGARRQHNVFGSELRRGRIRPFCPFIPAIKDTSASQSILEQLAASIPLAQDRQARSEWTDTPLPPPKASLTTSVVPFRLLISTQYVPLVTSPWALF